MGVHYEIISRSMCSLRTAIAPRFVSLLQSSGLLVADWPKVVPVGTRGASIHPAFARKLANVARTFAEMTLRQVDGLWFDDQQFDNDFPLTLRRQVMARRMDVEAAESLAAQASYPS